MIKTLNSCLFSLVCDSKHIHHIHSSNMFICMSPVKARTSSNYAYLTGGENVVGLPVAVPGRTRMA